MSELQDYVNRMRSQWDSVEIEDIETIISKILGFDITEKFPRFRGVFEHIVDCKWCVPIRRTIVKKGFGFIEADFYVRTRTGQCCRRHKERRKCFCRDIDNCWHCWRLEIFDDPHVIGYVEDDFDGTYRTFAVKFTPEEKRQWLDVKRTQMEAIK